MKRADRSLIFRVGADGPAYPEIFADLYINWQGNDIGEIGAAYVDVDPNHPQFSYSSLDVMFTPLDNLPNEGEDIRAWPMQWIYHGRFNPAGAGDFEFQGKFEINAFGGFRILEHVVVDQGWAVMLGPKEDFVRRGPDKAVPVPPLPPNTRVKAEGGGPARTP